MKGDMRERIRNGKLLKKVGTPEDAARFVSNEMTIATAGDVKRGCALKFFEALARRGRDSEIKDLSLWASSLISEIDGMLSEAKMLKRKLGSTLNRKMQAGINSGRMEFNDIRAEILSYHARLGLLGKLDLAVVDAVAITEDGYIIPSHAPYDIGSYIEAAQNVIVEIDLSLPLEMEGMYDHYLPALQPMEIPLRGIDARIGTPYIPLSNDKIKHIIVSEGINATGGGRNVDAGDGEDVMKIARHLVEFFRREVSEGRMPPHLYPIEIGLGNIANSIITKIGDEFSPVKIFSGIAGQSVIDLVKAGKCEAVTCAGIQIPDEGWELFCKDLKILKPALVLRPIELINNPELVRRFRVIAVNSALEADIYGHVNQTHIKGVNLVSGVGGSSVYAGNGILSIITSLSMNSKANSSFIVPMVSHVDQTEHYVDIIVTECGLADLRGLGPIQRAHSIIRNCAHPKYRTALLGYLDKAKKAGGHEPHILDEVFSFYHTV